MFIRDQVQVARDFANRSRFRRRTQCTGCSCHGTVRQFTGPCSIEGNMTAGKFKTDSTSIAADVASAVITVRCDSLLRKFNNSTRKSSIQVTVSDSCLILKSRQISIREVVEYPISGRIEWPIPQSSRNVLLRLCIRRTCQINTFPLLL